MNADAADPLLTTAEVAARERTRPKTVVRWIEAGVTVAGRRVRLEGYRSGGRWRVFASKLAAFLRACNPEPPPPLPDPRADQKRGRREQRELELYLAGGCR